VEESLDMGEASLESSSAMAKEVGVIWRAAGE